MSKFNLFSSVSFAVLISVSPVLAADVLDDQQFEERFSGPAVSALNAKIEVGKFFTNFDDDNSFGPLALEDAKGYFVQGAVSAPLAGQFGLQIDAGMMNGDADVNFFGGNVDLDARAIGAHLFWRDPSKGLLGVYGAYADYDIGGFDIDNKRIGVEGEAYIDRVTLKGFVGKDFTDYETFGNEDYLAGSGHVDYYLTDNFMIGAGFDHSFDQTAFNVGFEMMADTGGIAPSIFTDVSFNGGDTTVMAGLRVYFAKDGKSLIKRHREDDPGINLFDNISALGNCVVGITSNSVKKKPEPKVSPQAAVKDPLKFSVDGCDSSITSGGMDIDTTN